MRDVGREGGEFHRQQLVVDAGNPGIQIDVIDHTYQVKARGFGRIDATLPTGFYTVRYSAADARKERRVVLEPDKPQIIEEPPDLIFASAAPLDGTSLTHEYHQAAAQHLSKNEKLDLGSGAELFFFVRDVDPGGSGNPASGISILKLDGEIVADCVELAKAGGGGQAHWAGRTVKLDPGSYRLCVAQPSGSSIELPMHLVQGWQIQVFALRGGGGLDTGDGAIVDLPGSTILMTEPHRGFEPHQRVKRRVEIPEAGEDLRLAELARHALAAKRQVPQEDLRAMLNGKWSDPLLGIFGVHLVLMRPTPDLDLAENVVAKLRSIVGGARHPDIDALSIEIARRGGKTFEMAPFVAPPLLRRGWEAVVRETAHQPHLLQRGTLPDRIVDCLWGGGAWLMWETPPFADLESFSVPRVEDDLLRKSPEAGSIDSKHEDYVDFPGVRVPKRGRTLAVELEGGRFEPPWDPPAPAPRRLSLPKDLSSMVSDLARQIAGTDLGALASGAGDLVSSLVDRGFNAATTALKSLLPELQDRLASTIEPRYEGLLEEAKLDESERALLLYLVARARLPTSRTRRDPYSMETMIDQLNLPASHIAAAAAGLATKLAITLAADRVKTAATSSRDAERPEDLHRRGSESAEGD